MRRSSSLPGKHRNCVKEVIQRRERFEEMQKEIEYAEQQEREEHYNILDAIVKLDYHALRLRQGDSFDLFPPSSQKTLKPITATLRRSSHCCSFDNEGSIGQSNSLPSSTTRSASLPKLPKIGSLASLRSSSKTRRKTSDEGSSGRKRRVKDNESAQVEALKAVVADLDIGKPLGDLLCGVSRHVLTHLGTRAFTVEQRKLAMDKVLQQNGLTEEPTVEEGAQERIEFVVQALRAVSEQSSMSFADVVGQVLWRNRRSDALQKKKHKDAVEDLSWVMPGGADENDSQYEKLQVVDDVFSMLCGENGRMNSKGWQKIVRLVGNSPVLAARMNLSDVDRLWYTCTRTSSSQEILRDVSLHDFKGLLLSLGETMKVHPWMLFLEVASKANSLASPSRSSTPGKLQLAFPSPHSSSRATTRARSNSF